MQNHQQRCNQLLEHYLNLPDDVLFSAMRYSVLAGGKRIRPLLVYAAGSCVDAIKEKCDIAAVAVELVHAYSLIHDDLPAMDNADLRRGQLTCHKQFNDATAILAGDALQSLAIEILTKNNNIEQTKILTQAMSAMVLGQSLDLQAENQLVSLQQLQKIHAHKTGALITASVQLGALCGDTNKALFELLTQFARTLGLAFQIQDDILDRTANTHQLGKVTGSDEKQHKSTYVTLLGLAGAQQELKKHCLIAEQYLQQIPNAEFLRELFDFIIERDY